MLDGLLKSKFYNKCKTNVKMTKTRVESIKKKKIAVQKFLKKDIGDLLRDGLDSNAYGRAEGLLIEQNMARCYELIESFCANLSTNLSLMQKQRECPEECKEVVASLIYAAARFADLPELRELRNMFAERYGESVESYTNMEFKERLGPRSYTKEMKLQLLQDIANELSVEWDSKALEQNLFTTPTFQSRANGDGDKGGEKKTSQRSNEEARKKERHHGGPSAGRETGGLKHGRDRFRVQSSSDEDSTTYFSQDDRKTSSSSSSDDDAASSKTPFRGRLTPPPYLKPMPEKSAVAAEDDLDSKLKPRSVRQRNSSNNLKPPPGYGIPRRAEDEEDRVMDELLTHYSNKKPSSNLEPESTATSRYVRGRRPMEPGMGPGRTVSMPPEPTSTVERGHTRAASFQPDGGRAVHPKLPGDYDELAARIAALSGK